MRFAYHRRGVRMLDWAKGPPRQARAADSVALGSLGGGTTLDEPTLVLPRPGAPEVILSGMGGCGCKGSCGCAGVGDLADAVPGGYLTLGVAAFLAWKLLFKRKRR